jgi:16S rRNA C1402 (ribose-2'-O) methylase RsmI
MGAVAPHDLLDTLRDTAAVLGGNRRCCVARELTKLHEELWRGTLAEAAAAFKRREQIRGEVRASERRSAARCERAREDPRRGASEREKIRGEVRASERRSAAR